MRTIDTKAHDNFIKLLEYYESLHNGGYNPNYLTPKMDPRDIWTEGYGEEVLDSKGQPIVGIQYKMDALKYSKIETKEQALQSLLIRTDKLTGVLDQLTTGKLDDAQLLAVTDFAYNEGLGAFQSSTIYRLIKSDLIGNIAYENFRSWNKMSGPDGKLISMDGLTARRTSEWEMFYHGRLAFFSCVNGIVKEITV